MIEQLGDHLAAGVAFLDIRCDAGFLPGQFGRELKLEIGETFQAEPGAEAVDRGFADADAGSEGGSGHPQHGLGLSENAGGQLAR